MKELPRTLKKNVISLLVYKQISKKTKAMYVGSLRGSEQKLFGLDWSDNSVTTLGVTTTGNENDHYELSYKKRLVSLKAVLNFWKIRKFSLIGKYVS